MFGTPDVFSGGIMDKNKPYEAPFLDKAKEYVNVTKILPQLMRTFSKLEVYKVKINDSKMDKKMFMPVLQKKEAFSSSVLEGTQATFEDVLEEELDVETASEEWREIYNCYEATTFGYSYLQAKRIDIHFFNELHRILMDGNVRKDSIKIGAFRETQNCVKNKKTGQVTYTPPVSNMVPKYMKNLLDYIETNAPDYMELIRIAIIHAQFETIHPYSDGNGRVGRILIPLYMCYKKLIDTPYFFISEAFESNKIKYYKLLMDIREYDRWEEWIIYFLETMEQQCNRYIKMVDSINWLYEKDLNTVINCIKAERGKEILELLFSYPIIDASRLMEEMGIPRNSANRYLQTLEEKGILFSNGKSRYVRYYYHDLLSLIS